MLHHHWYTWVTAAVIALMWTWIFDTVRSIQKEVKDWDGEK